MIHGKVLTSIHRLRGSEAADSRERVIHKIAQELSISVSTLERWRVVNATFRHGTGQRSPGNVRVCVLGSATADAMAEAENGILVQPSLTGHQWISAGVGLEGWELILSANSGRRAAMVLKGLLGELGERHRSELTPEQLMGRVAQ